MASQLMLAQTRQCTDDQCRFRFPWTTHDPASLRCPRCGAPVAVVQERSLAEEPTPQPPGLTRPQRPLHGLLDNVRSTFNVGSIFRSADGAAFQHLYLCGITPTPAHPKVAKTALAAEQTVAWSQHPNALDLAQALQTRGDHLWALEDAPGAMPIFAAQLPPSDQPLVLIVGHEVTGVDPGLLALCERIVALPMGGIKRSLNVAIAFGIAAYTVRFLRDEEHGTMSGLAKSQ
jgi:23S rRNA (guanosine2251-2'-O)-methyltransferase